MTADTSTPQNETGQMELQEKITPLPKSHTVEYKTWIRIRDRCSNPKTTNYRYYGGKGVRVCDRWQNSFANFYADMGPRPSDKHSIDRINSNGNYEPDNCRWATLTTQNNNKSDNHIVTYRGKQMTFTQAWRAAGKVCPRDVALQRVNREGWPLTDAIETPALAIGRKSAKRVPPQRFGLEELKAINVALIAYLAQAPDSRGFATSAKLKVQERIALISPTEPARRG